MTPPKWGKTEGPGIVRICRVCLTDMVPGEVLQNVLTGVGDFHEGDDVVTLSPSGQARMVTCWKCPSCGRSVTR